MSPGATALAVDATTVYLSNQLSGAILTLPLTGGVPVTLAVATFPGPIAVDSTSVYWGENGPIKNNSQVRRSTGGPGHYRNRPQRNRDRFLIPLFHSGRRPGLMKLPAAGGTPMLLATTITAGDLAVDSTSVYWADGGNVNAESIFKVAK